MSLTKEAELSDQWNECERSNSIPFQAEALQGMASSTSSPGLPPYNTRRTCLIQPLLHHSETLSNEKMWCPFTAWRPGNQITHKHTIVFRVVLLGSITVAKTWPVCQAWHNFDNEGNLIAFLLWPHK